MFFHRRDREHEQLRRDLADGWTQTATQLELMRTRIADLLHAAQIAQTKTQTELVEARAQLSALRASFEWLTEHVNRLEQERAALLARVLGLTVPAMAIGHAAPTDAPTPTQSRIVGRPAEDEYGGTIPALQAMGALFEDAGDEGAAALGAKHDAMGNVTWTK